MRSHQTNPNISNNRQKKTPTCHCDEERGSNPNISNNLQKNLNLSLRSHQTNPNISNNPQKNSNLSLRRKEAIPTPLTTYKKTQPVIAIAQKQSQNLQQPTKKLQTVIATIGSNPKISNYPQVCAITLLP